MAQRAAEAELLSRFTYGGQFQILVSKSSGLDFEVLVPNLCAFAVFKS